VLPFRDIFAAVFFVSVGMLVNPLSLLNNVGLVIAVTLLIVLGKGIITILLGLVLPASARTMVVVAAGLSQIGEFSFIVGQASVSLGLMTQEQYGLILAGALISIILNPFMFRLIAPVETALQRFPALWKRLNRAEALPELIDDQGLHDHVVVVGYGRVGEHIVNVLEQLKVPYLVVERDAVNAAEYQKRGIPTLFGDAANSEILTHVGLDKARALVVTVPEEASAELIVVGARDLAPDLPIIARAATVEGVPRLNQHGAMDVIHPELEGGLEIVRHTLLRLNYPLGQVQGYIDAVRRDAYDISVMNIEERRMLDQLVSAVRGTEIAWRRIWADSPLIGQSLAEANLRAKVGASVVAVMRGERVVANPDSNIAFAEGDIIGLLGDAEQVAAAERFIGAPPVEH
jgi:CPA2 family monovalent cation:H+ antiporter-2